MRRWIYSFSIALATLLQAAAPAMAATSGSPGQGLEISPPVVELQADPGQTISTQIRVRNVTAGELIAKGHADDFGAGPGENGQPTLLLNESGATRYSLKYWIDSVPDLDLAPQELKQATITITVPKNAEPGGHFGVIRFTATPPNLQGTGVALSASVGTLVLLKVSGTVNDNLSLVELSSWQKQHQHSFFEYGPVSFLVRFKNSGTVHEKPQGTISVYNTFGKRVSSLSVNPKGGDVLPDSIRRFEQTMDNKQLFGRYTAKLDITYATSKKISSQISFWIIPWRLILLILLGVAVLIWLLRLVIRRYNNFIISQARRR